MTQLEQFQHQLNSKQPLIMGVLNLTPDSFSDGGQFNNTDKAMQHVLDMVQKGADIIDMGGESTRPGSTRVTPDMQIERIVPAIERIRETVNGQTIISVDTTSSKVAREAISAGAAMINDISAGEEDPEILHLAAEHQVPICLMHKQGIPETMQDNPSYKDATTEILGYLQQRIDIALKIGIKAQQIVIDPGIGFGKRRIDNLQLLANLDRFVELGFPVLLGTSRKRFMGATLQNPDMQQLAIATATTTALGVQAGASIFRVHDVEQNRIAADLAFAIRESVDDGLK
ncbi:MAG: dihydropteroate synthase [Gammaproteobacteria bacterium]|nr:dihydropteroate synthase [Gammaproteobacteria bacterium]